MTLHWKLRHALAGVHPPARARRNLFSVLKIPLEQLKHLRVQRVLFEAQLWQADGGAVDAAGVSSGPVPGQLGLIYVCT